MANNQVTVCDVQDITMMETEDLRKWISLHHRSLNDKEMEEYWELIKDDLKSLKEEYRTRFPLIVPLENIYHILMEIQTTLRELKTPLQQMANVRLNERSKENGRQ